MPQVLTPSVEDEERAQVWVLLVLNHLYAGARVVMGHCTVCCAEAMLNVGCVLACAMWQQDLRQCLTKLSETVDYTESDFKRIYARARM